VRGKTVILVDDGLATDSTMRAAAAALRQPGPARLVVAVPPESERISHYLFARLWQFDAVIHFDRTRAVEPLERTAEWERGDLPETFPVGV
jgi:predicted phosphoribosyltransferase